MNKYFVLLILALISGTAAGWATNHYRYGYRTPLFGPITMDGEVSADNVAASIQSSALQGLARVELISNAKHDFGVMSPGEEGEHAYTIKNIGDEPLTLRIGATSCKCTLGSLETDSLQPGETTDITLSWTVKTDSSSFSQSAQIHTNDPGQPVVDLAVSGRVVREFEFLPSALSFGEIASGETIELAAKVYSYSDNRIEPAETKFTSDEMTELTEFSVEEYKPSQEEDNEHADANQAFRVKLTIRPGLQQGSISQNLLFGFRETPGDNEDGDASESETGQGDDDIKYIVAATTGRIVGPLSMIPNPRLTGVEGGGYIYSFGRLEPGDALTGKAFVVLKGSHRENTELTIGKSVPEGVIDAELGEPLSKGSMTLYPLAIKLIPGEDPIERLGKNKTDYGMIWIESENPEVPRMRIGVKFAIPSGKRMGK